MTRGDLEAVVTGLVLIAIVCCIFVLYTWYLIGVIGG